MMSFSAQPEPCSKREREESEGKKRGVCVEIIGWRRGGGFREGRLRDLRRDARWGGSEGREMWSDKKAGGRKEEEERSRGRGGVMGGDRKRRLGACVCVADAAVSMATVQVLKQVNWMPVGTLPVTNKHVCVCGCTPWFVHSLTGCVSPSDPFAARWACRNVTWRQSWRRKATADVFTRTRWDYFKENFKYIRLEKQSQSLFIFFYRVPKRLKNCWGIFYANVVGHASCSRTLYHHGLILRDFVARDLVS